MLKAHEETVRTELERVDETLRQVRVEQDQIETETALSQFMK